MEVFWKKNLSPPSQTKNLLRHYDFVILGSGITGLSLAYFLEEKGAKSILIIDKNEFSFGASSRNAGFITSGSSHFYQNLNKKIGKESTQSIQEYSLNSIKSLKDLARELKVSLKTSGSYTLQDTETLLSGKLSGNYSPDDASMNPYEFNVKLAKNLRHTHFSFQKDLSKVDVQYQKLIICTNLIPDEYQDYLPEVLTRPVRAQILCAHINKDFDFTENFYLPDQKIYFRFYSPYQIIIGGMRPIDEENENTSKLELNSKIQKQLKSWVEETFQTSITHCDQWAGIMSFTDDELPVFSKYQSIYFLGGFSGHGNGFVTKMSEDLASYLAHNKISNFLNERKV